MDFFRALALIFVLAMSGVYFAHASYVKPYQPMMTKKLGDTGAMFIKRAQGEYCYADRHFDLIIKVC